MAVPKPEPASRDAFTIHEDLEELDTDGGERSSRASDEAEGASDWSSEGDDEEEVDESVLEDMRKLEMTFKGISDRFRLINRIGEGTFSTVYKAEDLLYDMYRNDWNRDGEYDDIRSSPRKRRRVEDLQNLQDVARTRRRPPYVAIKKIYVTSSPMRIQNELELLHDLRGARSVCPLITAFRHHDQVVAVLPYFHHLDFRLYYRDFTISQIRHYFRALFAALHAVHKHSILHRDIKPTNFLYNPQRRHGVLVDFGLAEREGTDTTPCHCATGRTNPQAYESTSHPLHYPHGGYPKNDSRPSRRANRAGTRGFRAPEVLLKCTSQTTRIDIWSAGVILLTFLAKRFPFFNSADDIDATVEMATIFGQRRMKAAAALHGLVWESNIPTIGENGYRFEKLIEWSTAREKGTPRERGEDLAVEFLDRCLDLNPRERFSARGALGHAFLIDLREKDTGAEEEGDQNGEGEVEEELEEMEML